jgi:anti-sigma B factor antagonist
MPKAFHLTENETQSGSVVIRVQGELDATTTPTLLKRCQGVRDQRKNLVLNLAEVTFIASNGIGGLLAMAEDFRDTGLSLRLASLSASVQSVIKLLNLDRFLAIDDTEVASLSALKA